MLKTIHSSIYLFIVGVFACFITSCSQNTAKKHIFLIQSYERNYPAYEDMRRLMASHMKERNINADIFSFYLDCDQNPEKTQRLNLYNQLDSLSQWKPDLIVVNDDQALNAMLSCKHPAINSLPIIFMGVNYPNIAQLQKYINISGFHDKPDYRNNLVLIENLIGKCIVVRITDNTLLDQAIIEDMNEQIKDICPPNDIFSPDRVRLSGKNGISLSRVQKIKPSSMYITTIDANYARSLIKGVGENYYNKAYLATNRDYVSLTLGRFCAFPGFSVINEMIGYDNRIVGGYISTLDEEVNLVVNRIADIFKGVPLEDFPKIIETSKNYVFDYKALEQWQIPMDKLPTNAIFVNMPFYIHYKYYILSSLILLGGLLTILFIYQRIQYKREKAYKKEAQKRLRQEKEFLSFALESGNIYTFRYKNGIFQFDKEFYRVLDIPEQPITADRFQEAIHPDEQADFIKNRYKLDHGFPSRQVTCRRYNFNQKGYQWWEFRYAQNTLSQETISDNQAIEVSGLCLNIQQSKDLEQTLITARQKAEESDHLKSVFLANMSHEIRTPLNAIVGFSQLLGSDMPLESEIKAEFTDLINKNSDLLLKLINDILDLSRIEAERVSFTFENHNLSELINDVFQTHKVLMPKEVELRKKTPEQAAIIYTDRFRLTQVLTNFINNATKFTAQGYIELSYEYGPDNQSILISVADTGIGIPKEKIEQVFERFQKLDEFAQGTGLGLAISKSIIRAFRGTISLQSEQGKGSKFTIQLPYSPGLTVNPK